MVAALAGLVPFQVALVVRDLERAVRDFDGVLSAGPWRGYVFDGTAAAGREYHGEPADWSVRLVLNERTPQYDTAGALGFIVEAVEPAGALAEPAFRL